MVQGPSEQGGTEDRLVPRAMAGRVITLSARPRYTLAIGAAAAAILVRLALDPLWGSKIPFITLFPGIMLSAWFGGLWPGMVTTVLCAVAADYFWIEPIRSWAVSDKIDLLGLFVFTAVGAVISALNETWRRGTVAVVKSEKRLSVARREAETAAEQLRIALEAGRMGTWQYTIATGAVRWSPGLEAIHGFAPGSFPGTFDAFRNEIHPDHRERVLAAIGAAVDERRAHHVEYRIVRSDGAVRWVEGRGQLFCDSEGRPERIVCVFADSQDTHPGARNATGASPSHRCDGVCGHP